MTKSEKIVRFNATKLKVRNQELNVTHKRKHAKLPCFCRLLLRHSAMKRGGHQFNSFQGTVPTRRVWRDSTKTIFLTRRRHKHPLLQRR